MNTKILVVDDDKAVRDVFVHLLKFKNFEAKNAESGLKAIELARQERFDIIFLDIKMPYMDGFQTLESLKKIIPEAKYVLMTGCGLEAIPEDFLEKGASLCLNKPFDVDDVLDKIRGLIRKEK